MYLIIDNTRARNSLPESQILKFSGHTKNVVKEAVQDRCKTASSALLVNYRDDGSQDLHLIYPKNQDYQMVRKILGIDLEDVVGPLKLDLNLDGIVNLQETVEPDDSNIYSNAFSVWLDQIVKDLKPLNIKNVIVINDKDSTGIETTKHRGVEITSGDSKYWEVRAKESSILSTDDNGQTHTHPALLFAKFRVLINMMEDLCTQDNHENDCDFAT